MFGYFSCLSSLIPSITLLLKIQKKGSYGKLINLSNHVRHYMEHIFLLRILLLYLGYGLISDATVI